MWIKSIFARSAKALPARFAQPSFARLAQPSFARLAPAAFAGARGPAFAGVLAILCSGPLAMACDGPAVVADEESRPVGDSFEIRIGERVRDWCERLEARQAQNPPAAVDEQALNCATIRRAAATLQPVGPRFDFVPAPDDRLNRFEGLFVPGRYSRLAGESVNDLVLRLLEATADRLERKRDGIASADYNIPGLEFNAYRQMILASIVEKEAASNRGYEGVAAVFLNRLRDNEVLGSCPTVEYALGYHRPFLLFKDLELKSPYNVYKRRGLPPTPIAFFSDEAFAAVRNPIDSAAYFFVYDWTTGDLIFADDYGAHKRNAKGARERFIAKFGKETIYKKYDGLFYELPAGGTAAD
ncbi:MAG: endolytic transglycosylase MltG [bacterium]|nr:endolytic transglycosylase MltG [bacterium]